MSNLLLTEQMSPFLHIRRSATERGKDAPSLAAAVGASKSPVRIPPRFEEERWIPLQLSIIRYSRSLASIPISFVSIASPQFQCSSACLSIRPRPSLARSRCCRCRLRSTLARSARVRSLVVMALLARLGIRSTVFFCDGPRTPPVPARSLLLPPVGGPEMKCPKA